VIQAHEAPRVGIQAMLESIPSVRLAESFSSVDDALHRLEDERVIPDVLIVSTDLGQGQLERLGDAVTATTRVLVLLSDVEPAHLLSAARVAADGFLLEAELTTAALSHALLPTAGEDIPMPASMVRALLSEAQATHHFSGSPRHLSGREVQVLGLLADGMTNRAIGRTLSISEHSVKRYVRSVLTKLDAPSRASAVALAVTSGLLSAPTIRGY
jgi:DNA-binding NarL/FixJ family response regulator